MRNREPMKEEGFKGTKLFLPVGPVPLAGVGTDGAVGVGAGPVGDGAGKRIERYIRK